MIFSDLFTEIAIFFWEEALLFNDSARRFAGESAMFANSLYRFLLSPVLYIHHREGISIMPTGGDIKEIIESWWWLVILLVLIHAIVTKYRAYKGRLYIQEMRRLIYSGDDNDPSFHGN